MNTPKYLEIAELIRIDIFVKYTKANQLIPSIRRYAQIYNVNPNTVCGNDIRVYDDELAEALKKLPERKRDNVLMYYFLELSDTKIADILNITRSGAFRSRYHALEALKKSLKEEK